ncbi:hypothetical protein FBU30_001994 [Linnemannia zychae]|nr:hypothetical protein FBU30_001994 [Linnemannia zychae]
METPPEHKLIFLNELHEMLKQFNPRHVRSAGYFRILGQLLEYDIDCQMAKIGSLFHHEYTSGSIDLSFFTGDRKVEDRKSHNSRPEPKVQAQETKQVFGSTGYCPIEAASRVHSINGTNTNNNSSTTIDLTLDDDEEDQDVRKDLYDKCLHKTKTRAKGTFMGRHATFGANGV